MRKSAAVGVEAEVARLGPGPFTRAHASDGEGADGELVTELQEVAGAVAQEGDDHVPGNPKFVRVLSAEEATEAPSEAGVGCRPGDGRRKVAVAMAGNDGVNDALEGGARGPHGGEVP